MNISQTQPTEEQTASQVAAKNNVIEKPSEVKDDYMSKEVGIKAMQQSTSPSAEVMSPFRKKRGTLIKLKVDEDDEEDAQLEKLEEAHRKIEPIYQQILLNFEIRQKHFEDLKKNDLSKKHSMYDSSELQTFREKYVSELELHIPESLGVDQYAINDFKLKRSEQLKKIETFIHIVSDWLIEAIEEVQANFDEHKDDKKPIIP